MFEFKFGDCFFFFFIANFEDSVSHSLHLEANVGCGEVVPRFCILVGEMRGSGQMQSDLKTIEGEDIHSQRRFKVVSIKQIFLLYINKNRSFGKK